MNKDSKTLKKYVTRILEGESFTCEDGIDVLASMMYCYSTGKDGEVKPFNELTSEYIFMQDLVDEYTLGFEHMPPKGTIVNMNSLLVRMLEYFEEEQEELINSPYDESEFCELYDDINVFLTNFALFLYGAKYKLYSLKF